MSSLAVLVILLGLPACIGYIWPRYTAFLVPVFLFGLTIASHVDSLSSASHPDDEVNGIAGIYFVANAAGFLLCACGVALGKRQEKGAPPNTE